MVATRSGFAPSSPRAGRRPRHPPAHRPVHRRPGTHPRDDRLQGLPDSHRRRRPHRSVDRRGPGDHRVRRRRRRGCRHPQQACGTVRSSPPSWRTTSSPAALDTVGAGLTRDLVRKVDQALFSATTTNGPGGCPVCPVSRPSAPDRHTPTPTASATPSTSRPTPTPPSPRSSPAPPWPRHSRSEGSQRVEQTAARCRPQPARTATDPRRPAAHKSPVRDDNQQPCGPISRDYSAFVVREQSEVETDSSVYFTSDRVAIRAKVRVGFGFPTRRASSRSRPPRDAGTQAEQHRHTPDTVTVVVPDTSSCSTTTNSARHPHRAHRGRRTVDQTRLGHHTRITPDRWSRASKTVISQNAAKDGPRPGDASTCTPREPYLRPLHHPRGRDPFPRTPRTPATFLDSCLYGSPPFRR